jgi:hypothetical protein
MCRCEGERLGGNASNDESNAALKKMLREVEHRALIGGRGRGLLTRERITRVPVTEEIVLSVRNIKDEDANLSRSSPRCFAASDDWTKT